MDFQLILQNTFNLEVMIYLVVGTVGGIVIGALPGLSASMGVALLIPITFGISPVAGLVMLTAVYTSAIYGGSITAVLIHTPGTPASAATAMDGYEMTKRGEGVKAIGIVTIASMIGGTISAIALMFISPPLAQLSLKFSAPEYFLMALFGLTIIGSLAGDSLAKGLISGMFGLMVGIVGLDPMMGIPRYTFGIINLESGVSLVPAMIGMFSISQVLIGTENIFAGNTRILNKSVLELSGKILPTWKEFRTITPTILKSSIIGVLVGLLPGAGGDIGAWVGYNEAKRSSKHKEMFGKGSIEGIAAAEAANNAVTGGALIPLLTLGIPGSAVAALLLGGLMIHGLQPGHELFTIYAGTTYPIMLGFLMANILMGVTGLLVARQIVKVSTVPMTILCPLIVGLSAVGAYAINNSMFDVYVMIFFGLVGYFMRKTGFGAAPLVLGIILGNMVEANFRRSIILSRGDLAGYFFSRPFSMALMILILLSIAGPLYMRHRKNKGGREQLEQLQAN